MHKIVIFAAACVGFVSCTKIPTYPVVEKSRNAAEYIDRSEKAMVSTSNPDATQAGLDMLKQGGNAIDAATAVSFALSVVRPHSTGVGGGGFMVYFDAEAKKTTAYDFRERAPEAATRDMYIGRKGMPKSFKYDGVELPRASINGHLAAGVPGLVKGLIETHDKHGKLPLKTVMAPAIKLADEGFPIYKHLAGAIERRHDVLKVFPDSRKIFLKTNGMPRKEGELLVQDDLAKTLRLIAEKGAAGFYDGVVAQKIIAEMKRGKGIISVSDLKKYRMKKREPVEGTYRGYKVVSMPPPSSGGVHIVQMLNMLEPYDLKTMGYQSTESIHLITEVMRRAFADRAKFLGDDDFVEVPVKQLVSKSYAKTRMESFSSNKAGDSDEVGAGEPLAYESSSTTHFSIVDQFGNAVSSTQTINGAFGSGVVAQGTGIVLNNEMDDFSIKPGVPNLFGLVGSEANAVAARKTMLSSMSPTIVFDKNGKVDLVVGSPGGPRIINATLHTIINRIDYKLEMPYAVFAFRYHHQWLPDKLFVENGGISDDVLVALKKLGHDIELKDAIGRVQVVAKENDTWIGVADSRGNGYAAGL